MSIKGFSSGLEASVNDFFAAENVLIPLKWDEQYNMPLQSEMAKAFEIQVQRVRDLMDGYARRNYGRKHAVEMFSMGYADLNNPGTVTDKRDRAAAKAVSAVIKRVHEAGRNGSMPRRFAAEFTHTLSDFPTLTLACVRRQLLRLSENVCIDDCLSDIFYTGPARDICENTGKLGLRPVKAPAGAGCGDIEDCDVKFWQFGELERGDFQSYLYRDSVKWSWLLSQCSQYGGWTDELVSWVLRIQEERINAQRASLLGNSSGINTDVFNNAHQNLIWTTDGVCNPSVTCASEAYFVLETFARQWAYHRDLDGNLTCPREFRIITPDWNVKCAFEKAMTGETTEHYEITADGACVAQLEMSAGGCFNDAEICYSNDLREVMRGASDGAFFIVPVADNSPAGQNAFEEAPISGFETTQLAQRVPAWETLGGRPMRQLGMDYCWNQEVLAVRGHGFGVCYPELAFASDGSNECPEGYTITAGQFADSGKRLAGGESGELRESAGDGGEATASKASTKKSSKKSS